MEPKPRNLDQETREPLTIELSQQHLYNLQKYIERPLKYRDKNMSFEEARYNKKLFKGAMDYLKSGKPINIRRVNPGRNGWTVAVGLVLGDEFYLAFMEALFGRDEKGISGEEFGKIDAELRKKQGEERAIVLKFTKPPTLRNR